MCANPDIRSNVIVGDKRTVNRLITLQSLSTKTEVTVGKGKVQTAVVTLELLCDKDKNSVLGFWQLISTHVVGRYVYWNSVKT